MHANLLRNSLHFRKGDWSRNCTLTFEDTRYWLFAATLPSLDLFISLLGVEEIGVVHWLGRECLDPLGTDHLGGRLRMFAAGGVAIWGACDF